MDILTLPQFARALGGSRWRVLGLDMGAKRIGIALSDTRRRIATPHRVLARERLAPTLAALGALCDAENIGGIVVGLPLHMDGRTSRGAQSARAFARNFLKTRPLPLYLQDERLSSQGAARALASRKQATQLDTMAAAWILQTTLDAINSDAINSLAEESPIA